MSFSRATPPKLWFSFFDFSKPLQRGSTVKAKTHRFQGPFQRFSAFSYVLCFCSGPARRTVTKLGPGRLFGARARVDPSGPSCRKPPDRGSPTWPEESHAGGHADVLAGGVYFARAKCCFCFGSRTRIEPVHVRLGAIWHGCKRTRLAKVSICLIICVISCLKGIRQKWKRCFFRGPK